MLGGSALPNGILAYVQLKSEKPFLYCDKEAGIELFECLAPCTLISGASAILKPRKRGSSGRKIEPEASQLRSPDAISRRLEGILSR